MKLFSVIIPAYNAEKTIEACINSVTEQNNESYEVIVVNDKSTDRTAEILKQYEENKNIRVIHHTENKKAGGARNTGIKAAQGEYVLFLDADDVLIDGSLEKLKNKINETNCPDVIYMGFQYKTSKDTCLPKLASNKVERLREWDLPNVWDVLWNRKFLLENNIAFEEKMFYEDFMFYYKGILASKTFGVAQFVVHIYTDDNESMTRKKELPKMKDYCYMTLQAMELASKQEEIYQKALLKRIERNTYWIWKGMQKLIEE